MKLLSFLALSLFALVIFTACPQEHEDDLLERADISGEYEMTFDETLDFPDADFSITFDQVVEDSRCPTHVVCVWEGLVKVNLSFLLDGEPSAYEFIKHEGIQDDSVTEVGPYTITLLEVNPYPEDIPLEEEDYWLKISVEE